MTSFDAALTFTLAWEGGYVHDPDDRGGETNMGITRATYDAWSEAVGLAKGRSLHDISLEEVRAIYCVRYWLRCWCDKLPPPLALVTFDAAVHSGPKRAVTWLQQALGNVPVDGLIGPQTLARALSVATLTPSIGAFAAAKMVLDRREEFLRGLAREPSQAKFLKGWMRRIGALRAELEGD